jgi:hypothetical protein
MGKNGVHQILMVIYILIAWWLGAKADNGYLLISRKHTTY